MVNNSTQITTTDGAGSIKASDIGTVMRSLGMSPTEADVANIIAQHNCPSFDFTEFLTLMARWLKKKDNSEEEIREAFKVFDKDGNGRVSCSELRHVLTNIGECLTEDEVNEMFAEVNGDPNGDVSYEGSRFIYLFSVWYLYSSRAFLGVSKVLIWSMLP